MNNSKRFCPFTNEKCYGDDCMLFMAVEEQEKDCAFNRLHEFANTLDQLYIHGISIDNDPLIIKDYSANYERKMHEVYEIQMTKRFKEEREAEEAERRRLENNEL